MQAVTAASGREALPCCAPSRTCGNTSTWWLLDQQMPGMTGMQLAARINEDENLNHDLLLIMLTRLSNAPSKVIARNAGIKRVLAKPVAGYTLRATLADELSRRGQRVSEPEPEEQPSGIPSDFRVLVPRTTASRSSDPRHAEKARRRTRHREQRPGSLEKLQQNTYDLILNGLRDAAAGRLRRHPPATRLGTA